MNYKRGFANSLAQFLIRHADLPQYMKRVQIGVATEVYHPRIVKYYQPRRILATFQEYGPDWMVHLVTKSNRILDDADLLGEMREQVQVEVSLVTLDEQCYQLFERGTPTPRARLKVIEELSKRGIFVRAMCMPVMRRYNLVNVGESVLPLYRHVATGKAFPMRKVGQSGSAGGVRYTYIADNGRGKAVPDPSEWEPIILEDFSKPQEMRRTVYDLGARAFKCKDLNYFYVDALIEADQSGRPPVRQRGKAEDPDIEILEHSGEAALDSSGNSRQVEVEDYAARASKRAKRPVILRSVMDYGYRQISKRDWVDCV